MKTPDEIATDVTVLHDTAHQLMTIIASQGQLALTAGDDHTKRELDQAARYALGFHDAIQLVQRVLNGMDVNDAALQILVDRQVAKMEHQFTGETT